MTKREHLRNIKKQLERAAEADTWVEKYMQSMATWQHASKIAREAAQAELNVLTEKMFGKAQP